ncbi:MAG: DUF6054 family protein [Erysipelotrichaceae bacterium]|nr:DUF6054 family protein [Erysipelotrichaceae bacterium]
MMFEAIVSCDFDSAVERVCEGLLKSRTGYTVTEQADYLIEGKKTAIRMIERYASAIGERTAVQLTFIEDGKQIVINAIASGYDGILFMHTREGQKAAIEAIRKITEEL